MVIQPQIEFLLRTATAVFGEDYPLYQDILLPKPLDAFANTENHYIQIPALWTRDGLRPRWDNLAAIAAQLREPTPENLVSWQSVVDNLQIPLIVLSFSDHYLLISSDRIEPRQATSDSLHQELEEQRRRLFSPRSLSRLRSGQLSFADLEETLTENSFAFHLQHRGQLDQALTEGVKRAIEAQLQVNPDRPRALTVDSVIITAVAYLAARILEDKGFFDNRRLLINDPSELLAQIIDRTDGFFKHAYEDHLPYLDITTLQELAAYIGNSVSFTLVDDHDVGRLYEQAMQVIPQYVKTSVSDVDPPTLLDLQQHYTPQAVAERMLNLLPLERLRPEERVIFDPAAGSGSLLVAATRRLALMPDVAMLPDRRNYLAQHVMGNDLDPNAKLITKLRYTLVQETFGQQQLFPDPEYFEKRDYHQPDAWNLPLRPRVVVANPPFAEDDDIQRAVRFIHVVTQNLQGGDQFAVVLPQTFLTGSTHGLPEARRSLSEQCHILETWQLPEGAIGLSVRQPVCIVLGVVKQSLARRGGTIAKSVVSGAQTEAIRNKGFLGQAWIAEINTKTADWRAVVAPPIPIDSTAIPLGDLFYVCTGVGLRKDMPPISNVPKGAPIKPYWMHGWRKPGTLWANPDWIPREQRYIRFGRDYLDGPRTNMEWVFDSQKILVSRSTNRNSRDPLAARLDTVGFCPNNDVFCIVPFSTSNIGENIPKGWTEINYKQQLLWLLGILSSPLAIELSMSRRDTRHLNSNALKKFELPTEIDLEIIRLVDRLIQGEMDYKSERALKSLREQLNKAVEASYGNPERNVLTRTGRLPDLELWEQERKLPSVAVTGQVLDFDPDSNKIHLYLDNLLDEEQEAWVPLPQELPGWALDGTVFEAELSREVETFDDLANRPWALRNFKHTPRPYLTLEELQDRLLSKLGIGQ